MRKKCLLAIALAAMLSPLCVQAQDLNSSYVFETGVDADKWITLSASDSSLSMSGDDSRSTLANIGFPFNFCGNIYTQWSGNTNGRIRLGSTLINTTYGQPFSSSYVANDVPCLAFIGCDGRFYSDNYARYKVVGEENERILVIEYNQSLLNNEGVHHKVQIQLSEADNSITYVYGERDGSMSSSYQVGISSSATDFVMIDVATNTFNLYSAATSINNPSSSYPELNRFYKFTLDTSICLKPSMVSVSDITPYTATITWTSVPNVEGYVIEIPEAEISTVVSDTTYEAQDLLSGTPYTVNVRTICGPDDTSGIRQATFATEVLCYPVQNLQAVSVLPNSVSLQWSYLEGHGLPHDNVTIRLHDNTDGTDDSDDIVEEIEGTYYFFTGLESLHTYTVTVTPHCGDENAQGESVTFVTPGCGHTIEQGNTYLVYSPINTPCAYSICQNLYLNSEVQTPVISGLRYKVNSPGNVTNYVRVYMANTTLSGISPTQYVPFDQMTLVADSVPITPNTTGWTVAIPFDTPFVTDGSNLAIAVHNITGQTGAAANFKGSGNMNNRAIYKLNMSATESLSNITGLTTTNYLPDIEFVGNCDGCAQPNVLLTRIDSNEAYISWVPGGEESEWTVEYRAQNDAEWIVEEATDTNYVFQDLNANTVYEFRVGAECEDGTIYYNTVSGRTLCGTPTLPMFEGFEGYANNNFPSCWTATQRYNSYPFIQNNASNAHTGTGYLYTYAQSSTNALICSPVIPADANDIYVRFWVRGVTPGNQMLVGVATDPTEVSSFIACTAIPTGQTAGSYSEYEFSTENVTVETPVCVAFKFVSSTYGYIDDISISHIPACTRPANATASANGTNVTFHWTSSATDFVLYYRTTTGDWQSVEVNDEEDIHEYTISELNPLTQYQYYIEAICEDGETNAGIQSTFTTGCGLISELPWTENFDSYSTSTSMATIPCWDFFRGSNSSYNIIITNPGNNRRTSSPNSLRFSGYASTPLMAVLPPFATNVSELTLTFNCISENSSTSGTIRVGYITDISDTSTFVPTLVIPASSTTTTMATYDAYFDGAPTGSRIAIQQVQPSNNNMWWWVDDLIVQPIPLCTPPVIALSDTADRSVTLSIADMHDINHYIVYFGEDTIDVDGNSYEIEGLMPSSYYEISAVTVCDDTTYTRTTDFNFTTECAALSAETDLPYTETFEEYNAGGALHLQNPCWNNILYSTYPSLSTRSGGGKVMYFYVNGPQQEYLVMPALDDLENVAVRFQLDYGSQDAYVTVGVMENPTDTSTFTALQTFRPRTATAYVWETCTVSLNAYEGDGHYVAFRMGTVSGGYGSLYINDVTLMPLPECMPPQSIEIGEYDNGSVTVSLTDISQAGTYHLQLLKGATVITDTTIEGYTCTFDGLEVASTYRITAATVCDTTETISIWANLNTICEPIVNLPWTETFDGLMIASGQSDIHCWDFASNPSESSSYVCVTTGNDATNEGNGNSIRFNGYAQKPLMAILPMFDENISNLEMSFYFRMENDNDPSGTSGSPGSLRVGYITDLSDTSTFVQTARYDCVTGLYHQNLVHETISFAGAPDSARIALQQVNNNTNYWIWVDGISITRLAGCPSPVITISNVGSTSITVEFLDGEDNHVLVCGTDSISVSTTTATVGNLSPNTQYTLRSYTVCDNGELSRALTSVFTTECGTITHNDMPYTENFNSYSSGSNYPISPCWYKHCEESNYLNYPYPYSGTVRSGNALYFNPGAVNYPQYAVLPYFDTLNDVYINLWVYRSSEYVNLEVGVMETATDTSTFTLIQTLSPSSNSVWTEYRVDFNTYSGQGKRIALRGRSTNGSHYNLYVDDIEVGYYTTCIQSVSVSSISDLTEQSATINYTLGHGLYDHVAITVSDSNGNVVATGTSNNGYYTVTGLDAQTQYSVVLQVVCNEEVVYTSQATTFSTFCEGSEQIEISSTTTPYNSYTGTTYTPFYPYFTHGLSAQVYTAHEMGRAAELFAISFDFARATPTTHYSANIYLGHKSDSVATNVDLSSLTQVYSGNFDMSYGWNTFSFTTPFLYNGTDNLVVVVNVTGTGYESDNVNHWFNSHTAWSNVSARDWTDGSPFSLSQLNGLSTEDIRCDIKFSRCGDELECPAPSALSAEATAHSATLTFTGTASSYEVGISTNTWTEPTTPTSTTLTSYTFTELQPETDYFLGVRSVCADGTLSSWRYILVQTDGTAGLQDYVGSSNVILYPNPAETSVSISGLNGKATISVIDASGRCMINTSSEGNTTLDISTLSQGAYYVRVVSEEGTSIRKLIVR